MRHGGQGREICPPFQTRINGFIPVVSLRHGTTLTDYYHEMHRDIHSSRSPKELVVPETIDPT